MLQLEIKQCLRDEVELVSDMLEELGTLSITLTDQYDDPILEPAPGAVPLWPHVVIGALYATEQDVKQAIQTLSTQFPHLDYVINTLPEEDWERACLDQFKPQQFGKRLWICPSWLTPPDPHAVNLTLDPGLAFGTGTHPTTSLCLRWLEQADLNEKMVIDYGCGSGILALAALKLGAAHVDAVDIDEQALLATQNNAQNNHLSATQLNVEHPDTLHTPVDVLIANILLMPLIQLQQRFRILVKDTGSLVISGLLTAQIETLIETYQTHFIHIESVVDGDWALVVFKPRI